MSARRWVPPLLWAALILGLTSIPNPNVGGAGFPGTDKLLHGALYFVLGWLIVHALGIERSRTASFWVALLVIGVFAATDEMHQRWIAGRSAEQADWLADLIGAALGMTAARLRLSRGEPIR